MKFRFKLPLAGVLAATLVLVACSGGTVGNIIAGAAGGKGQVRLVDASPDSAGPLSLVVAATTINSGVSSATPFGIYAQVGAGPQTFTITPSTVPGVNKSIAASTFYTVVLGGQAGNGTLAEYIFQDTNSVQSPTSVRFKVDDAAPALGTIDVYVYQGATLPATPTVAGLTAGQDSGSIASPPGNSYIPPQGSATTLPSGVYTITVTAAGVPGNVLFTGSATLNVNSSYSFIVGDSTAGPGTARVLLAVDQPPVGSNQSSILTSSRQP